MRSIAQIKAKPASGQTQRNPCPISASGLKSPAVNGTLSGKTAPRLILGLLNKHWFGANVLTDSFEDRATLGLVQWITVVEKSDATGTLRIGLTHNPEDPATERSINFTAVTKVVSDWEDRDDECMESIIGAHEDVDEDQLRYLFRTEQRELWIWAKHPATIGGPGV